MKQGSKGIVGFVLFFILIPKTQVFSQKVTLGEIQAWFQTEPIAAPYREAVPSIMHVFESASSEGLPLDLLFDKLKEGMAKQVPFSRLLSVLEGEAVRLAKVRGILQDGFGKEVEKDPLFLQGMKVGSLALLSGFPEEGLKVVCKPQIGIQKMVTLVPPLVEMHRIDSLPTQPLAYFVQTLSDSSIPSAQYGSFISLYLKATANRIPPPDTLRLMGDILKAGGGILQIERELARRTKR